MTSKFIYVAAEILGPRAFYIPEKFAVSAVYGLTEIFESSRARAHAR